MITLDIEMDDDIYKKLIELANEKSNDSGITVNVSRIVAAACKRYIFECDRERFVAAENR